MTNETNTTPTGKKPMNVATLDGIVNTPVRSWNIDGLPELTMGLFLFCWGGAIVAQGLWPSSTTAFLATWMPMMVALVGMTAGRLVLAALKRRLTDPRVGYVKQRSRPTAAFLGALIAAAVASVLLFTGHFGQTAIISPAGIGVVLALGLSLIARQQRAPRFAVFGGIALVAGIALNLCAVDPNVGIGIVQLIVGILGLMSGALVLRRMLCTAPAVHEGDL
jgi:hypothetical protein